MVTKALEDVAETHGVDLILQFGSTVEGTAHAESDLDLAVQFEELTDLDRELALQADIQQIFPQSEVDLTIINRADPLLLKRLVENCRLLYGSSRDLAQLQILAFKRYQDHRRYLALEEDQPVVTETSRDPYQMYVPFL